MKGLMGQKKRKERDQKDLFLFSENIFVKRII
jgi:hypothetical protein